MVVDFVKLDILIEDTQDEISAKSLSISYWSSVSENTNDVCRPAINAKVDRLITLREQLRTTLAGLLRLKEAADTLGNILR